uniref:Uncharacterized protein n=1 Tax=Romanomermis culicivorax TaxID=13658 RepID=A0A915K790_ROMCU
MNCHYRNRYRIKDELLLKTDNLIKDLGVIMVGEIKSSWLTKTLHAKLALTANNPAVLSNWPQYAGALKIVINF